MDIQDAIVQVVEEWRKRQGLTHIQIGRVIAGEDTSDRIAGEIWGRIVKVRKDTGKKRQLSVSELDKLASFFGVNPETIIIEARHRLGKISGRSEEKSAKVG